MNAKPKRREYTRRLAKQLTPDIMGHYHDLLMKADVTEFERLLDLYQPGIEPNVKADLIEEFKHYAARILRSRWRPSR